MKTIGIAIILFIGAAVIGAWLANNGLDAEATNSAVDALVSATNYAESRNLTPPRYVITLSTGASNALWGGSQRGYIILDTAYLYEYLDTGLYVVRQDPLKRVFHPIRAKQGAYWIMQGDGNSAPDDNLLTPDNFVGVAVDGKIWRF